MIKRLVLLSGVFVLMLVTPASAQTGGGSGTLTCSVQEAAATISCTATGYLPGAAVTFPMGGIPTPLGTSTAGSGGAATLAAPLPGNVGAGQRTVTSSGTSLNGGSLALSTQVVVSQVAAENAARNANATATTTAPGNGLPQTGSDDGSLIKIGVLLVALGGGAVLVTRKRRAKLTR